MRRRVEQLLLRARTQAASWNARRRIVSGHGLPAGHRAAGRRDRPLQAAAANRRRRHGRRLHGRADRADRATRRAENHQARHGHSAGDRPLRGRATSPGDDGPSEHRQSVRRGHDRHRPALLRDGTGQGHSDHGVLRRAPARSPANVWSCSSQSARRSSTLTRKASSIATSSRPTCWSPTTTTGPVPKVIDFGVAKATDQRLTEQDAVHRASARSSARWST